MTKPKEGYRGYVTHRPFGGLQIPATIQNLIFRDYAQRNKLLFKLSVNEYVFPNCYSQLDKILDELPSLEGIFMSSLFMLPPDSDKRQKIYEKFIKNNAELHLILEGRVIKEEKDIEGLEEVFKISQALEHCPKTINASLLPDIGGDEYFSCLPPNQKQTDNTKEQNSEYSTVGA